MVKLTFFSIIYQILYINICIIAEIKSVRRIIMQRSGILRKLDEVGRIVIPKEIRKYLKLEEGSNLEIGINELGEVVLSNNCIRSSIGNVANAIGQDLYNMLKKNIVFIDNNIIIYSISGTGMNKTVSEDIYNILHTRSQYIANLQKTPKNIHITDDYVVNDCCIIITPVVYKDSILGGIVCYGDSILDYELKLLDIIAKLCVAG